MSRLFTAVLLIAALSAPATADATTLSAHDRAKRQKIHRHYSFCNTWSCVKRVDKRRAVRYTKMRLKVIRPYRGWIKSTAACESGGDWTTNTGNGFYGGLQFTLQSWHAVGGVGYPHQNSELEQKYRGVLLRWKQGTGAWPECG